MAKINKCIFCKCTEKEACLHKNGKPCYWVILDTKNNLGVCSKCFAIIDTDINLLAAIASMSSPIIKRIHKAFKLTAQLPSERL